MYPNRYRVIKEVESCARGNRKEMIQKILSKLKDIYRKRAFLPRERSKTPKYSIAQKWCSRAAFSPIMDIYAFRVIVHGCRYLLSRSGADAQPQGRVWAHERLHRHSKSERLSIFAYSMIGPHGVPVEVQIRTEDMDCDGGDGCRRALGL